jgi:hypothetical protein
MPEMNISVEGKGGAFEDVFRKYPKRVNLTTPIHVETLDRGMDSGNPSVAFILEVPELEAVILAQTSVRLFQLAAVATMGRYGDVTGGGLMGSIDRGKAELTFSRQATCDRLLAENSGGKGPPRPPPARLDDR